MVQPRKERSVRRHRVEIGVRLLVRNRNRQTERAGLSRPAGGSRPFVGGFHETRTAARHDVAAELGQARRQIPDLEILPVSRLDSRTPENCHAVEAQLGRIQLLELLDRVPQPHDRAIDDLPDVRLPPDLPGGSHSKSRLRQPGGTPSRRIYSAVRSVTEKARESRPSSVTAQTV